MPNNRPMSEHQYALMRYFVDHSDRMGLADWCEALERAYELGRHEGTNDNRPTMTGMEPVQP